MSSYIHSPLGYNYYLYVFKMDVLMIYYLENNRKSLRTKEMLSKISNCAKFAFVEQLFERTMTLKEHKWSLCRYWETIFCRVDKTIKKIPVGLLVPVCGNCFHELVHRIHGTLRLKYLSNHLYCSTLYSWNLLWDDSHWNGPNMETC